jgi:hypothetical protein
MQVSRLINGCPIDSAWLREAKVNGGVKQQFWQQSARWYRRGQWWPRSSGTLIRHRPRQRQLGTGASWQPPGGCAAVRALVGLGGDQTCASAW